MIYVRLDANNQVVGVHKQRPVTDIASGVLEVPDGTIVSAGWSYADGTFVPPPPPPPQLPTVADIVAERARRLALGFDYNFGDARGVHRVGTTDADMAGWREVTDYANALIDLGDVTTTISIVTDTGPAMVTAPEWQAILLRAAQVRQAVWAASFALQAMPQIPQNYADDSFWA